MKAVIYSKDNTAITLLKALLDAKFEVILPTDGEPMVGDLILIDHSYPHTKKVLSNVGKEEYDRLVLAVMSFNPYAISKFLKYNIDAFLSKPLQVESIQSLIIGVEARNGSLSAERV